MAVQIARGLVRRRGDFVGSDLQIFLRIGADLRKEMLQPVVDATAPNAFSANFKTFDLRQATTVSIFSR